MEPYAFGSTETTEKSAFEIGSTGDTELSERSLEYLRTLTLGLPALDGFMKLTAMRLLLSAWSVGCGENPSAEPKSNAPAASSITNELRNVGTLVIAENCTVATVSAKLLARSKKMNATTVSDNWVES